MAHMGGLNKRQHIDVYLTMAIRERDRRDLAVICRGDVDTAGLEEAVAERETLGTVMVAADDEYRQLPLRKTAEEIIEYNHGLGRRDAFIIHVTRDHYCIGFLFIDDAKNLGQNILLILQKRNLVQALSDM